MNRRNLLKTVTAALTTTIFPTIIKSDVVPALVLPSEFVISKRMFIKLYEQGLISKLTLLNKVSTNEK